MFIDEVFFDADRAVFLIYVKDIDAIDLIFAQHDLSNKRWAPANNGYATLIVKRKPEHSLNRFAALIDRAADECYAA